MIIGKSKLVKQVYSEEERNMREFITKAGYVLLGVLLTVCVIFISKKIGKSRNSEVAAVTETQTQTNSTTVEETLDYNAEAEQKLQELKEKQKTQKETQTETQAEGNAESTISANSIEAAKVKWIKDYPTNNIEMQLGEKEKIRSSYDETLAVNTFDKKVIEESNVDFSNVKITMMGDSITAASNMSEDDQKLYSIPVQLQQILGAKEVVNLGIGGSTVSRASDASPMVDRYSEIPMDSDIVIIMGGTNDCLFENKWQYGHLEYDKRMESATFCGDLDEMLSHIEYSYRDNNLNSYIKLLYVNPPSTVLNDSVYNTDPGNMIHQVEFAQAINEIAPAYSFEVIDMYDNNILNTHDTNVVANFMPDGVHGNQDGYRIMAEHIASQIIQRIDQE